MGWDGPSFPGISNAFVTQPGGHRRAQRQRLGLLSSRSMRKAVSRCTAVPGAAPVGHELRWAGAVHSPGKGVAQVQPPCVQPWPMLFSELQHH